MGQVSKYLRNTTQGYSHWCPGCQEMHELPTNKGWTFNGNVNKPTFSPSFLRGSLKRNIVDGQWVGEGRDAWIYDANGNPVPDICHYFVTDGNLNFCGDCTHALSGKIVPMPELPDFHKDEE